MTHRWLGQDDGGPAGKRWKQAAELRHQSEAQRGRGGKGRYTHVLGPTGTTPRSCSSHTDTTASRKQMVGKGEPEVYGPAGRAAMCDGVLLAALMVVVIGWEGLERTLVQ